MIFKLIDRHAFWIVLILRRWCNTDIVHEIKPDGTVRYFFERWS